MFWKTSLILGCAVVASVAKECVPYNSPYDFQVGYPPVWKTPDQSSFNTPEFQKVYHSIDWSQVPNIKPRVMNAAGQWTQPYPSSDPDCWWTYSGCTTPKHKNLKPDVTTCPEPDTWGLTFDGGPNCTQSQFYDFLKANNQRATMFYIGSNVADWPIQAKRGIEDGHHICVHTWSHPYMTTLTNEGVVAEFYYTMKAIKTVLGVTPTCWRPPYGDIDDRIRAIAKGMGLTSILWHLDTDDWNVEPEGHEPASVIDKRFQSFVDMGLNGTFARSGTIVLEHELNNGTMSLAEEWYPKITQAFKHVVPVATCMNITTPYVEKEYTYPDFAQYISGDHAGDVLKNATHQESTSYSSTSTSTDSSASTSASTDSSASTSTSADSSASTSASAGSSASTSTDSDESKSATSTSGSKDALKTHKSSSSGDKQFDATRKIASLTLVVLGLTGALLA